MAYLVQQTLTACSIQRLQCVVISYTALWTCSTSYLYLVYSVMK